MEVKGTDFAELRKKAREAAKQETITGETVWYLLANEHEYLLLTIPKPFRPIKSVFEEYELLATDVTIDTVKPDEVDWYLDVLFDKCFFNNLEQRF